MTTLDDLRALLLTPSKGAFVDACDLLEVWPEESLAEALHTAEEALRSWDALPDPALGAWPMPLRRAPDPWARDALRGRPLPAAFRIVRLLQLHDKKLRHADLLRLLDHPELEHISHLYLAQCDLGPDAPAALSAAPHLRSVTHLVLLGNPLRPGALAALLQPPLAPRLKLLNVATCGLDGSDLEALLASPWLEGLESLTLNEPSLEPAAWQRVMSADNLPNLRALVLGSTRAAYRETRDLARGRQGHLHLRRAAWAGWLNQQPTAALKALAADLEIPSRRTRSRALLLDALTALPGGDGDA